MSNKYVAHALQRLRKVHPVPKANLMQLQNRYNVSSDPPSKMNQLFLLLKIFFSFEAAGN